GQVAHRAAEELRTVEQRLDHVGHATPAHQADEQELEPLGPPMTMLDRGQAHRRYSCGPPLPKGEGARGGGPAVERRRGSADDAAREPWGQETPRRAPERWARR